MKTIEVTISPEGTTSVETRGFSGSTCQDASRFLEQALGTKQEERMTSEFYQTQVTNSQQAQQRA